MHRFGPRVALAAVLVLLVTGCASPGQGVADAIRAAHSPIVREVDLSPANPLVGRHDEIAVYLVDEATDAQALDLWCTVVVPAGVERMEPDAVQLLKGGEPQPGGASLGVERVLPDPVCPGPGSPVPSG